MTTFVQVALAYFVGDGQSFDLVAFLDERLGDHEIVLLARDPARPAAQAVQCNSINGDGP